MSRRKTTEEFIQDAKEVHGDKYDYSKVDYKNNKTKVTIVCPEHGEFKQLSNDHLRPRGCPDCGVEKRSKSRRLGTSKFIERSKEIHGDKYDYSNVVYKNMHTKVLIVCPVHGEFKQRPNGHLNKRGCPDCGDEAISKKARKSPNGWSYSKWIKSSKKSDYFDSFKIYIIRIFNNQEEFFKIGRTYTKLKTRFNHIPDNYNYEILYVKKLNDGRKICELEQKYKNKCSSDTYIPEKEFDGMYECYSSIDNLDFICI